MGFPTNYTGVTDPGANDTLAAVPHHTAHVNANEGLRKIGSGATTPTAGTVLNGDGTGTSAWTSLFTLSTDPAAEGVAWAQTKGFRFGRTLTYAGTGTASSANEFNGFISTFIDPTSSAGVYQKNGLYVVTTTNDPSDVSGTTRDAVGVDMRGYIAATNSYGRAWGGIAHAWLKTGGQGHLTGFEIDVANGGDDITSPTDPTGKQGLLIVAQTLGGANVSAGVRLVGQGTVVFHHGVYFNVSDIGTGTDDSAFTYYSEGLSDWAFRVKPGGGVYIHTNATTALELVNTAGNGAEIKMTGTSSTSKYLRVSAGNFSIYDTTDATELFKLTDAGALIMSAVNVTGATFVTYATANLASTTAHRRVHSLTVGAFDAVLSGDLLGVSAYQGSDGGSAFRSGAVIEAQAAENFDTTHWGTRLMFLTAPTGGGSPALVERMRIKSDGGIQFGGATGPQLYQGTGSPESAITAAVGSFYLRTDGGAATSFYVKESGAGNTGWVGK